MDVRKKLVELIDDALQREEGTARVVGKRYVNTIADHLISHRVTVQEWISVKDRLPTQEDAEKYLLEYEEYNEYLVMIEGAIIPTVLMFDGENWFNDADDMYAVTHWMPLPQPPKGE